MECLPSTGGFHWPIHSIDNFKLADWDVPSGLIIHKWPRAQIRAKGPTNWLAIFILTQSFGVSNNIPKCLFQDLGIPRIMDAKARCFPTTFWGGSITQNVRSILPNQPGSRTAEPSKITNKGISNGSSGVSGTEPMTTKSQEGRAVGSSGGTLDQQLQCTIQDRWMQKLKGFPQGQSPKDESLLKRRTTKLGLS